MIPGRALLLPTLFLTNGLTTLVQLAHNVYGLATVPWITYISPVYNLNRLATANHINNGYAAA